MVSRVRGTFSVEAKTSKTAAKPRCFFLLFSFEAKQKILDLERNGNKAKLNKAKRNKAKKAKRRETKRKSSETATNKNIKIKWGRLLMFLSW
jgi:hypothetical protein